MVHVKSARLTRIGNCYGFLIPKALVDCDVLAFGKNYFLKILEISVNPKTEKIKNKERNQKTRAPVV